MTGKWVLTGGDYEDGMVAWVEDNKSSVRQVDECKTELLEALKLITKYSLQEKVLEIARAAIARTEGVSHKS